MKRRYFLALVILSTVILTSLQNGKCQQIEFYSFGNGYDYEVKAAHEAFRCIAYRCFSQLKRTRFIDKNTQISENLGQYLDSLHLLKAEGSDYIRMTRTRSYYSTTDIPPLTFYGVFQFNESKEVFFQIKLTLSYHVGGLLKADRIELIKKDFFLGIDDFKYKYDFHGSGSKTNFPAPPPPPPPPAVEYIGAMAPYLYSTGRINLCNACQVRPISTDLAGRYWLHEKYDYEHIRQLRHGFYLVKENNLYGVINDINQVLVPILFDKVDANSSGVINVKREEEYGVYDFDGNIIVPVIYEEIRIRIVWKNKKHTYVFVVKKDGKYGVITSLGEEIIPALYDKARLFYSKYFRTEKDGKFGLVSINGDPILDPVYQEIDFESSLHADRFYNVIKDDGEREIIRIVKEEGGYKIERFAKIE